MNINEKDENEKLIKALFLEASDFILNGHPVSVDEIGAIHTFKIIKGDFLHANYKFTGIASITINHLSQLYEFEGNASENEITESIIIKKMY